jgi:hypothetical protein
LDPIHYAESGKTLHEDIVDWYRESVSPSSLCGGSRYGFGWSVTLDPENPDWDLGLPIGNQKESASNKGCLAPDEPIYMKPVIAAMVLSYDIFDTAYTWFGKNATHIVDEASGGLITTYIRLEEPAQTSAHLTSALESNGGNSLNEGQVACLFKTMEIPADVNYIAFDVRFESVGEEDLLTLSIDNEILLMIDALTQGVTTDFNEVSAYVGNYAGQTVNLQIALRGEGESDSVVHIDNLRFTKLTLKADTDGDGIVNFPDFAALAGYWGDPNCADSNDCAGIDFEPDGDVDANDLAEFTSFWLQGIGR